MNRADPAAFDPCGRCGHYAAEHRHMTGPCRCLTLGFLEWHECECVTYMPTEVRV